MAELAPSDLANNPSQTGGPGITLGGPLGAPVNGTATPPAQTQEQSAQVDPNDPVAVAEAALAKAKADKAAAGGEPAPVAQAPAVEQPKVENVPSKTDDTGAVVYDETGDPGLDLALSFIGRLGIAGDDPAMVAAANGDFSFIEAKLSTLGDEAKGWEKHIELGKQAFARQLAAYKAEQGKTLAVCHQVAGGEAQWKALIEWAGTVASPEEKAALNAMFDAGPIQAQMAARSLVAAHAEAKGTTIAPANPATAASGVAPAAPKTLTAADYHKEADALYRKLGNAMDGSQEYADLKRRYFGR